MNDFKCENIIFVEEMEMKFSTMFKPLVRIPSPPIFQRVDKIYNSRLVGKNKLLFIENSSIYLIFMSNFSCKTPSS